MKRRRAVQGLIARGWVAESRLAPALEPVPADADVPPEVRDMDYELVWTEPAAADFEEILRYIASQSPANAEAVRQASVVR